MKAKEYAKNLKDSDYNSDAVNKMVKDLLDEVTVLAKSRNVSTISGLNGVVQEIRQKWVAISNRSEGHLKKESFDQFLISRKLLNEDCSLNANLIREGAKCLSSQA